MKQLLLASILTLPTLFYNCKTSKYTPENFPEIQLIFGEGGGFTGAVTEYVLLENGQFFKKESTREGYDQLEPIAKTQAKELFDRLNALRLHKLDINHPGNLYYFIRLTTEELDHTLYWGAGDYNLRRDIMDFYKSLIAVVKNRKVIKPAKKKDK